MGQIGSFKSKRILNIRMSPKLRTIWQSWNRALNEEEVLWSCFECSWDGDYNLWKGNTRNSDFMATTTATKLFGQQNENQLNVRPERVMKRQSACVSICVFLRGMFIAFIVKLCNFVHQRFTSFTNLTLFVLKTV